MDAAGVPDRDTSTTPAPLMAGSVVAQLVQVGAAPDQDPSVVEQVRVLPAPKYPAAHEYVTDWGGLPDTELSWAPVGTAGFTHDEHTKFGEAGEREGEQPEAHPEAL